MKQETSGNILVAEDNVITQKLLGSIIRNLGFKVSVVFDGLDVLDKLKNEVFDVVIMDYQMPRMNGLETVQAIESNTEIKNKAPVIMLTGEINEETLRKLENPDIYCVLKKPIQYDVLSKMILQLVKKRNKIMIKSTASTKYLQRITHSNKELMVDIINVFIEESPRNINKMMTYCLMEDWENLSKLVHKVKANYTYVGITEHEVLLDDLEVFIERMIYSDTYLAKIIELREITQNAIEVLKKKKTTLVNKIQH